MHAARVVLLAHVHVEVHAATVDLQEAVEFNGHDPLDQFLLAQFLQVEAHCIHESGNAFFIDLNVFYALDQ